VLCGPQPEKSDRLAEFADEGGREHWAALKVLQRMACKCLFAWEAFAGRDQLMQKKNARMRISHDVQAQVTLSFSPVGRGSGRSAFSAGGQRVKKHRTVRKSADESGKRHTVFFSSFGSLRSAGVRTCARKSYHVEAGAEHIKEKEDHGSRFESSFQRKTAAFQKELPRSPKENRELTLNKASPLWHSR